MNWNGWSSSAATRSLPHATWPFLLGQARRIARPGNRRARRAHASALPDPRRASRLRRAVCRAIDRQFLDDLYRSAPLHDIGKVGIPDAILLKPGRLSEVNSRSCGLTPPSAPTRWPTPRGNAHAAASCGWPSRLPGTTTNVSTVAVIPTGFPGRESPWPRDRGFGRRFRRPHFTADL